MNMVFGNSARKEFACINWQSKWVGWFQVALWKARWVPGSLFGRLACWLCRRLNEPGWFAGWGVRMGCSLAVEGGLMGLIEWVGGSGFFRIGSIRMARWLGQGDWVSSWFRLIDLVGGGGGGSGSGSLFGWLGQGDWLCGSVRLFGPVAGPGVLAAWLG